MYTILITAMLLSKGSYPVAISNTSVGEYKDVATCQELAKALNDSRIVGGNFFHQTARCVQAKDKS